MEKISVPKAKNCLDAKKANLYCKIGKILKMKILNNNFKIWCF